MESFVLGMLPAVALAVALAATIVLGHRLLWRGAQGRRRRYHPVAGTVLDQVLHFDKIYDYLTELARRHKTFRVLVGFRYEIYTCDPAVVEHILSSNFRGYGKGWYFYETMEALLGDGIFVVDGSKWLHQRKLSSRQFSTRFLRDYSGSVFKNNATKLAEVISDAAASDEVIDVQELFMKSTMDSIFEVAFGVQLNCVQGSDKEAAEFARAFDESSALIMWRFVKPLWKLERFLNVGSEAVLRKNINRVDEYVYKMIHAKISRGEEQLKQESDILSRFLQERAEDPTEMSLKYLRDIILSFVIAGKDTTAGTLSWFFHMLCKHPFVQEKISREVGTVLGEAEAKAELSFGGFAGCITEEALEKMNYLRAALSETLRLYPAVPLDSKVCLADDRLPDGFDVVEGEVINFQPYAMGRMKYIWGEDAEDFRPERWLDEDGVFRHESPYKFTAFQAGPRLCLGKEFAYRQMTIFAAVLLRFFEFKLADEKKAVEYKPMLTLHINGGLRLHAFQK
ncbi:unnamed protein product [Spirodela intermedia]|uniref:Uncharacterized protein n=1 Tax=Spirodela intermedia TaxID=51605 RepID=A0A7I8K5B1_SPIIN|nr:unnamed protein product [Spirodela intermedia]